MQSYHEQENKFFVGGINISTSEPALREYFERFGPVVECTIQTAKETGRSRGFGFVTFDSSVDRRAILETTHFLDDKHLDVKDSIPRGTMSQLPRLFVSGIPYHASEEQIRDTFSRFGTIIDFVLPKDAEHHKGFVTITFREREAATHVLSQPIEILGVRVDCRHSRAQNNPPVMSIQQPSDSHTESHTDPMVAMQVLQVAMAGSDTPLDPKLMQAARTALKQLMASGQIVHQELTISL
ncbi:hypothetical protein RCL1_007026 [Eukaryota sp. TZLM3-RCL]